MKLVEQHLIRKGDLRFAIIDQAAFASKNLYNQAMYQIRQAFLHEGKYLPYAEVYHRVKGMDCYKALPGKVANSILILIHKNWVGYFKALDAYQEDPTPFTGRPRIPGYKHKEHGRNILIYDTQALGKRLFRKTGKLIPSGLSIEIETRIKKWEDIDQVRIVPRGSCYVIEVVYRKGIQQAEVDPHQAAALDLGVNVLAAITSTKVGFSPLLVNGCPLKSLNQLYNKQRAQMQSELAKENRQTSRGLDQITMKRNRRVNAYLHTASRRIIDLLVEEGIGLLVLGKNPLWKQEVEMGRKQNQQFVQIPHARFIEMLTYKAELVGIQVQIQEESYTSKASFLDLDHIPTYDRALAGTHAFRGSRSGRWYRSQSGKRLHSDTNGSYNILRKAVPKAFEVGIEGCVVIPRQLALFT